jgi:5'(3')-deoxyribonucleotidase
MGERKILYVDMDNVIVDFKTGIKRIPERVMQEHIAVAGLDENGDPKDLDDIAGIFSLMDPIADAVESVIDLSKLFEVYILSSSPWNNPSAWSDKLKWIHLHFGSGKSNPIYKRLILSHHKNLNDGHFLVDDRIKNGAEEFGKKPGSEHIHFGVSPFENWNQVSSYLRSKA